MAVTNTGIVLRTITGVHDANFVHPIGDEEILNGDFSNGSTDWSLAGPVPPTITNNKLNLIGDTYNSIASNIGASLVSGKTYKVSFEITDYTSGGATFRIGSVFGVSKSGLGVHTQYIVSDGAAIRLYSSENGTNLSLDNVSVKEMLVNRESTATNTGIVERAITGLNESVAFRQDTRTNLITYSEDFSDVSWITLGAISIDEGYLAPDGSMSATKVTSFDNTGAVYMTGASTNYSKTIYARTESGIGQINLLSKHDNTNNLFTINEQWQRLEVNLTTSFPSGFSVVDFRGSSTLSEVIVWGAQIEALPYATSYIPTNGAAVTVDSNSTSVVNNTGIVERPITGVNESDALFPDNTESTVVNISDTIIPLLTALEARATTFENREGTQNILINIQKC